MALWAVERHKLVEVESGSHAKPLLPLHNHGSGRFGVSKRKAVLNRPLGFHDWGEGMFVQEEVFGPNKLTTEFGPANNTPWLGPCFPVDVSRAEMGSKKGLKRPRAKPCGFLHGTPTNVLKRDSCSPQMEQYNRSFIVCD